MKASKEAGSHERSVKKLMTSFHRWFLEEINSIDVCVSDIMLIEVLLSIVMRIDLGVDLDTCKGFARYFMPYFEVFPFIQEKLAALNVTYDEPQYMSLDEVRKYFVPVVAL